MIENFLKLFRSQTDKAESTTQKDDTLSVAFSALLIEAAKADEDFADDERKLVLSLLSRKFELNDTDAAALLEKAETAQANAIDLHRFTKDVKTLSEEERVQFIENLWEIILSDGVRDPFEDALVRRVCSLIHITDRSSGEARRRVEARRSAQ